MSFLDTLELDKGEGRGDGRIRGLVLGVVTDNKDPEGLARVRVRLTWQEDGSVSYWARCAVLMAGNSQGTFFLPEIGDEVLLGAEDGDPSHLYVLGMLWNGESKPPASNDDGKNSSRFIRTRAGHELRFSDESGAPLAELKLQDGKKLTLDKDGIQVSDGQGSKIVIDTKSSAVTVTSAASLTLKSAKVTIQADTALELKSSGTLIIQGTMVQIN